MPVEINRAEEVRGHVLHFLRGDLLLLADGKLVLVTDAGVQAGAQGDGFVDVLRHRLDAELAFQALRQGGHAGRAAGEEDAGQVSRAELGGEQGRIHGHFGLGDQRRDGLIEFVPGDLEADDACRGAERDADLFADRQGVLVLLDLMLLQVALLLVELLAADRLVFARDQLGRWLDAGGVAGR